MFNTDLATITENDKNMVKTIKIDDDTHSELSKLGSIGQTFNDVIRMLIEEHKQKRKK